MRCQIRTGIYDGCIVYAISGPNGREASVWEDDGVWFFCRDEPDEGYCPDQDSFDDEGWAIVAAAAWLTMEVPHAP